MEFCPGGDLEKHLRKQGATITDYERIIYLVEVGIRVASLDSKKKRSDLKFATPMGIGT